MKILNQQKVVLLALVIAGLLWRGYYIVAVKWDSPAGDESVAGLMAKHIAEGREFPFFYYGQAYFGALEPYLNAILFRVIGFTPNLIFLLPIIFGSLIVATEYQLVRTFLGQPIALATAGAMALAPTLYLRNTLNAGGGFGLALFLQMVALWFFLRVYTSEGRDRRTWLIFCAISGLLCWVWQLYLIFLPFLLILLGLRRPAISRQDMGLGLIVILVTASPFWVYNILRGGASFVIGFDKFSAAGDQTSGSVLEVIRSSIMNRIWSRDEYVASWLNAISGGNLFLLAILLLGLAFLLWNSRRKKFSLRAISPVALLIGFAVIEFVIGHRSERYLQILPLLLLPCALAGVAMLSPRLVMPCALLLIVTSGLGFYPAVAFPRAQSVPYWYQVIAELRAHDLRFGYSDYEYSYNITFLSAESIIAAPLLRDRSGNPVPDRYPAYAEQVRSKATTFLLLSAGSQDLPMFAKFIEPTPNKAMLPGSATLYWGVGSDSEASRLIASRADTQKALWVNPSLCDGYSCTRLSR